MMKKTHHSTGIGITVLLMAGGMFIIFTGMEVYGQEQHHTPFHPFINRPNFARMDDYF